MVQSDVNYYRTKGDLKNFWKKCLSIFKDNLSYKSYKTWFIPIVPISLEGNILTIQMPAPIFKEWVFEHYKSLLEKTVAHYLGKNARLIVTISEENLMFSHDDKANPIKSIINVSKDLYDDLITQLKIKPEILSEITPFEFEELVASLLRRRGFDVKLTPKTKDGGKDILAMFHSPAGDNLLYFVECKKYRVDRPIGVDIVRALYGTVQSERANMGMLVTTSSFTKGAKSFEQLNKSQISLKDYDVLKDWIHRS